MNFAGDETWKVRVHPRIDGINVAEGYTTGGQEMIISGWSFNSTDISITVDGVDCPVNYDASSSTSITCTTGEADAISTDFAQPGTFGIKVNSVDPEVPPFGDTLSDGTFDDDTTTYLYTAWEEERNRLESYGTYFSGYFKAPATTNYRFYTSADDECQIYLDSTTPYDADSEVTHVTEMIAWTDAIDWKTYWRVNDD